jgi:hypothetical protein
MLIEIDGSVVFIEATWNVFTSNSDVFCRCSRQKSNIIIPSNYTKMYRVVCMHYNTCFSPFNKRRNKYVYFRFQMIHKRNLRQRFEEVKIEEE